MDVDTFWNTAISLTGLGGIASFVFYSLYKEWLKLSIFPTLTKDQAFKLFRLFLILTFLFVITALFTCSADKNQTPGTVQSTNCGPTISDTDGDVTITGNFDC